MPGKALSFVKRPAVLNNGLFTVLSLAGAALNYLLYPVLARLMPAGDFGDVSAVAVLAAQIGGIMLAFNVVSLYVVRTLGQDEGLSVLDLVQKLLVQILVVFTAVLMAAGPWLIHVLKINNPLTFLGLGIFLILTVPAVIWTGILQARNEMARIGVYNASSAGIRLMLAVAFTLAGWGAPGAIFGIVAGQAAGLLVTKLAPGGKLPVPKNLLAPLRKSDLTTLRELLPYVLQALFVMLVFSLLFSADLMLAKVLFSRQEAGLYAGVSSFARIIFYSSSLVIWILLANLNHPERNRIVLRNSLAIIAGIGAVLIAIYLLLGDWLIREVLGKQYLEARHLLEIASLFQAVASLLYAYTLYLLVLRKRMPYMLAGAIGACSVGLGLAIGGDVKGLLTGMILGCLLGFILHRATILLKESRNA